MLACFVGWQVVWNVTPALHTPLMSVTNAISGIIVVGGMLHRQRPVRRPRRSSLVRIAILLASINIAGGFLVTQRMLRMFQALTRSAMPETLVTVAYLVAGVLFILSLGGLSAQESARRGNLFGIAGMAIAVLATMLGPGVSSYGTLLAMLAIGGLIGAALAARVQMTAMPQLVAILHSFVGAAAVLVGFAITSIPHCSSPGPTL